MPFSIGYYFLYWKVIPFKTHEGKYGLIKVIHSDEKEDGVIEIAIKVQK